MRTVCLLSACLACLLVIVPSAQADLLYRYTFETYNGQTSLENIGSLGGSATPMSGSGSISSSFTTDTSTGVGYARHFPVLSNGLATYLDLDNSADRIGLTSAELASGQALSVSAWLKWDGPDGHPSPYQGIVSKMNSANQGWVFFVSPSGTLSLGQIRYSTQAVPVGEWTHVAMRFKLGHLSYFINGQYAGLNQGYGGSFAFADNTEPIRIGATKPNFLGLNGTLDDVRIYDTMISSDDINRLYQAGPQPPMPEPATLTALVIAGAALVLKRRR